MGGKPLASAPSSSAVASERLAACWDAPQRIGWREQSYSLLRGFAGARASQAVAGEIDAVRVMDDAIENGVGIGGITDEIVPFVDRDLAGNDGRSAAVTFFEDLEEIVARGGIEWFEAPIVESR